MGSSEGDIVNNNDDGEMGFQSMFNKSSTGSGNLFGSEWDPLENHHQGLIRHYHSGSAIGDLIPVGVENHHQGLLRHYNQSGSAIGTDSFPKVGSFGPFANINPESGPSSSPNYRAKRRFDTDSNGEKEERNDGLEKDEKKQSIDSTDKQMGKQAKHNSNSGDYIHVRAKRGQATNSHSLAERVRRERISERMKLLQDLVPGCNKITGKAVMLDEIINYVQSLQQQVEFLSMKLATVNPEVNIDIDRLVFKDILQSRGSSSNPPFGFGPAISSSHSYPHGSFPSIPTPTSTMHPIHPQPIWDNDLHNLLQMGFDANTGINNLGPNGQAKMNL